MLSVIIRELLYISFLLIISDTPTDEPRQPTDTPTEILYNYSPSVRNTYRNGNRQPHRASNRAIIIYQS